MANAAGNGKGALVDDQQAQAVLDTVRQLVAELYPRAAERLTLDSQLDRDLGLDSLALVELLGRLESAFGVTMPDELLLDARTPRDLLAALGSVPLRLATSASAPAGAPAPSAPQEPADSDDQWAPVEATTLPEVLAWHAARHPDRVHIKFLAGDDQVEELTYGGLLAAANGAAASLQRLGVGPGDSVALMLPTNLDYFVAFFGALLAGGVPVPIYPPARMAEIEEHLQRQGTILENARAKVLISVPEAARAAQLLKLRVRTLTRLVTVADLRGDGTPQKVAPAGSATALLQYTSGSTSMPKGVVLSHDNLLACIRAMGIAAAARKREVFVSWLPLYHD
ncbi:MAG: AMP-binding protein, partial [Actinomycetota bacterium]